MHTYDDTIQILAAPARVWPIASDVVRWQSWLSTVTAVEALGAAPLAIGARYRILQPRLRPAVWTVTEIDPGRSFTWESRAPGVRTVASHRLSSSRDGTTDVALQIVFSGPLAWLAALVAGALTRDYLAREVAALKRAVEAANGQ